jgi:hypothetical protein
MSQRGDASKTTRPFPKRITISKWSKSDRPPKSSPGVSWWNERKKKVGVCWRLDRILTADFELGVGLGRKQPKAGIICSVLISNEM